MKSHKSLAHTRGHPAHVQRHHNQPQPQQTKQERQQPHPPQQDPQPSIIDKDSHVEVQYTHRKHASHPITSTSTTRNAHVKQASIAAPAVGRTPHQTVEDYPTVKPSSKFVSNKDANKLDFMHPSVELYRKSKSTDERSYVRNTYYQPSVVYKRSPSDSTTTTTTPPTGDSHENVNRMSMSAVDTVRPLYGRIVVDIDKGDEPNLGLTIVDGRVANIRPGSIVDRSDCLLVGDRLLSKEQLYKRQGTSEQTRGGKALTGPWMRLEIEYELPDLPPSGCTVKHMCITLESQIEGVGLVIRGGWSRLGSHIRPLTVMRVRKGSVADIDGRIKPGDRIVVINNTQSGRITCVEAMKLMDASKNRLNLVIEYNVANFESDRCVSGAIMVEIEKPDDEDLGISLAPCHEVKTGQNAFFINYLRQGSIADRCGALMTGDRVEAIDDIHVEDLNLPEAMRRLKHNGLDRVRLQIVPNAIGDQVKQLKGQSRGAGRLDQIVSDTQPIALSVKTAAQHSMNQITSTPGSLIDQKRRSFPRSRAEQPISATVPTSKSCPNVPVDEMDYLVMEISPNDKEIYMSEYIGNEYGEVFRKSYTSLHTTASIPAEVCRSEEIEVCLEPDQTGSYGFLLRAGGMGSVHDKYPILYPIIGHITPGGPAFKSGVVQEGDRVITMNGQCTLNRTIKQLTEEFLHPNVHSQNASLLRLTLVTQYSIADTVVPSSGVFDVKLIRRVANLGISLQASIKKQEGQPLRISKVIPGSVASRTGIINTGDTLLAVNGISLASCSLSDAIHLLQSPNEEVITLKVQKITNDSISVNRIQYSQKFPNASKENSNHNNHHSLQHKRSDSVPESESKPREPSVSDHQFHQSISRHRADFETKSDSGTLFKMIGPKWHVKDLNSDRQLPGDRSNSSEHGEFEILAPEFDEDRHVRQHDLNRIAPVDEQQSENMNPSVELLKDRSSDDSRDMMRDEMVRYIQVALERTSADIPWGIIICGTDEVSNSPVLIDSLNLGSPSALCGLLRPGDRIVSINGNELNEGHTLTQAMHMLQRYPTQVRLQVMRIRNVDSQWSEQPPSEQWDSSRIDTTNVLMDQPSIIPANREGHSSRQPSLKNVVATGNFSRSFDSMTNNSVGSTAGLQTAISEKMPSRTTTNVAGIPLGLSGSRPRSTISVRAVQEPRDRTRTYSGAEELVRQNVVEYTGSSTFRDHERRELDGRDRLMDDRSSLIARDQMRITNTTEHAALVGSGVGETAEETGTDTATDHPEFPSHSFVDYNELDLNEIHCSGCREAIINEMKQQNFQQRRHLKQQHRKQQQPVQYQSARYRNKPGQVPDYGMISIDVHNRRRTRSYPRTIESRIPSSTEQPSSDMQVLYTSQRIAATSYPYSEIIPAIDKVPSTSKQMGSVNSRHSKSDSRINLAGLTDESGLLLNYNSGPSTSLPAAQQTRTISAKAPARATHTTATTDDKRPRRMGSIRRQAPVDSPDIREHQRIGGKHYIPDVNQSRHLSQPQQQAIPSTSSHSSKKAVQEPLPLTPNRSQQQERGVWCTWVRIRKSTPQDSYGIGVSEGLSTRGIFVSAIRSNSSADRSGQLHLYDRIIMVNDNLVDELSCADVVGLISRSEKYIDLLIQRRSNLRPKPRPTTGVAREPTTSHRHTSSGTQDPRPNRSPKHTTQIQQRTVL